MTCGTKAVPPAAGSFRYYGPEPLFDAVLLFRLKQDDPAIDRKRIQDHVKALAVLVRKHAADLTSEGFAVLALAILARRECMKRRLGHKYLQLSDDVVL